MERERGHDARSGEGPQKILHRGLDIEKLTVSAIGEVLRESGRHSTVQMQMNARLGRIRLEVRRLIGTKHRCGDYAARIAPPCAGFQTQERTEAAVRSCI